MTAEPAQLIRLDVLSDHELYADANGAVGGVFVATSNPAPLRSTLVLELQMPWGETLQTSGEVEWIMEVASESVRRRSGMGVRFVGQHGLRAMLERVALLRQPMEIPPRARRG